VTIPSDFAASREVSQRIMEEVERRGYAPASVFAIKLAMEEAVINAIKHGNRHDPAKRVHIEARISPQSTQISVEDEGPGFDRGCVPDPRCDENLRKCSGRGILLIEAYMSSVKWSNDGRRITMVRMNDPEATACGASQRQ
jgi:serine/threonine-protein kinase RsbW